MTLNNKITLYIVNFILLISRKSWAQTDQTGVEIMNGIEADITQMRDQVEQGYQNAVNSGELYGTCPYLDSCGIATGSLTTNDNWGQDISHNFSIIKFVDDLASTGQEFNDAICSSKLLETLYLQGYRAAGSPLNNVAYQYFGDQRTGIINNYPGISWCDSDYDPRFRPWYSAAATGGKSVILVIDISGSMFQNNRIDLVKSAAKTVLDTLIERDYFGIVTFSSGTSTFDSLLVSGSEDNKARAVTFIDNLVPNGETDYSAGFQTAFSTIQNSNIPSSCHKALLFLSDGEITIGDTGSTLYDYVESEAESAGYVVFTYGLGSDLDTSVLEEIACRTDGIFYPIEDGDSTLSDQMAGYYQYFATGLENFGVTWYEYTDSITNTGLLAACLATYDRTTTPPSLFGVICKDINVEISLANLKLKSDWSTAQAKITTSLGACPEFSLTEDQLEELRKSVNEDSTCGGSGSAGVIVAVIFIVLFVVVIIAAVIFFLARRNNSSSEAAPTKAKVAEKDASSEKSSTSSSEELPKY